MQLFYPTAAHALNSYSSAGELSVEVSTTMNSFNKLLMYSQALLQKVALVQKGVKIHGQSVDFYLPQLSVAIEFQGKQHYQDIYRGSVLEYPLFTLHFND
jgi:very-short-patch-repair endonuclease